MEPDFSVRLVVGTFYRVILWGRKARKDGHVLAEYSCFNGLLSVITGNEVDASDTNHRNKIKYLKCCERNSFEAELDTQHILNLVRSGHIDLRVSMSAFISDYLDETKIDMVIACLMGMLDADDSITDDSRQFISSFKPDGSESRVSKKEILNSKKINYPMFLTSLLLFACGKDNTQGVDTYNAWNEESSVSYFAEEFREGVTHCDSVDLCELSEKEKKTISPEIQDSDFQALLKQAELSPQLYQLVNDISNHRDIYVETKVYRRALSKVLELGYIMLSGLPGSGKTCTSEMIALKMAGQGLRVSFLYGFSGIDSLFDELQREDKKTQRFILIDDCMGQAAYELGLKDNPTALHKLVSYVKFHTDRIKLVLNSRINIISEAKKYSIGDSILDGMKQSGRFLNLEDLSRREKAMILKRHVIARSDEDHYRDIGTIDERCLKIVDHNPFLPRVIDHVTKNFAQERISKSGDFFRVVMDSLKNPSSVWKKIYENSQATPPEARTLLKALYSLTKTKCEVGKCKTVFRNIVNTEKSSSDFEGLWIKAVSSLNESMISLSVEQGREFISFYDPSVHDYLENSIYKNALVANHMVFRISNKSGGFVGQ